MSEYQESELEEEKPDPKEAEETELLDSVMEPFDPTDIDIVVEPKSLDTLIERMQHNEINMNTDFQRHADLWDNGKMSRLIESILIRLPLPAFYFDASDNTSWSIVDGLQRLSSIRKFVIDKKLRLSKLEFLKDLEGKPYEQLHRTYQRRIRECPVTVYLIKPNTPEDVKYSVFRRINTGGLTLNNQEIRNALAKPADRQLLEELANLADSKSMLGDLSKRMRDQELVLRFWAFYRFDYLDPKNKKQIASFLDQAMTEIKQGDTAYREKFRQRYAIAINRCLQLLGEHGFEKDFDMEAKKRFKNAALFEVWMVTMAKLSDTQFQQLLKNKSLFQEKYRDLLQVSEFFDSITYSTQLREHVEIRYKKIRDLIQEVLHA